MITALLLISNLFVFTVSAANVSITSVYPEGKTSYSVGDTVKITGDCTVGKDLVIRIYNEKESLIFTDVILAPDNTAGTFEFTNFTVPETSSTGTLNYKVVISETQDADETTNIDTETMVINGKKEDTHTGGGGGGGGGTTTTMTSWVHHSSDATEEEKTSLLTRTRWIQMDRIRTCGILLTKLTQIKRLKLRLTILQRKQMLKT